MWDPGHEVLSALGCPGPAFDKGVVVPGGRTPRRGGVFYILFSERSTGGPVGRSFGVLQGRGGVVTGGGREDGSGMVGGDT